MERGMSKKQPKLYHGDCFTVLEKLEENSIDAVVTDPPAGVNFMQKSWDDKHGYEPKTERGRILNDALTKIYQMNKLGDKELMSLVGFAVFICDVFCEVFRVLKPGGHALVWSLPRTSDLTGLGLRAAGFEIRDDIAGFGSSKAACLFGSGFPKSTRVNLDPRFCQCASFEHSSESKVPSLQPDDRKDKASQSSACEPPIDTGKNSTGRMPKCKVCGKPVADGFQTAMKPSREDWILVRKPFSVSVAQNVLEHGTGALNIDGCRVETVIRPAIDARARTTKSMFGAMGGSKATGYTTEGRFPTHTILVHHPSCEPCGTKSAASSPRAKMKMRGTSKSTVYGEFTERTAEYGYGDANGTETVPAFNCAAYCPTCNHGFSQESGGAAVCPQCGDQAVWVCPVATLDEQSGTIGTSFRTSRGHQGGSMQWKAGNKPGFNDIGGASRYLSTFHYHSKASSRERHAFVNVPNEQEIGLEALRMYIDALGRKLLPRYQDAFERVQKRSSALRGNNHPTVKNLDLMCWLVRLVGCQKGSVILDPFMGSGSTGIAAVMGGFLFVGIEQEDRYFRIAEQRIAHAHDGQTVEAYLDAIIPMGW